MTIEPRQLDEEEAKRFGVAPGWWGVDEIGTPIIGPHPSREGALVGIAKSGRTDDAMTTAHQSPPSDQANKK